MKGTCPPHPTPPHTERYIIETCKKQCQSALPRLVSLALTGHAHHPVANDTLKEGLYERPADLADRDGRGGRRCRVKPRRYDEICQKQRTDQVPKVGQAPVFQKTPDQVSRRESVRVLMLCIPCLFGQ